jgi:hypothetical protein
MPKLVFIIKYTSIQLPKGLLLIKRVYAGVKKYPDNYEFALDKNKHFSLKKIPDNGCMYGFLIKGAVKFDITIPYLGKLGFFDVCDSDI